MEKAALTAGSTQSRQTILTLQVKSAGDEPAQFKITFYYQLGCEGLPLPFSSPSNRLFHPPGYRPGP